MKYVLEKCGLLGLNDQKEILDTIGEEIGFKNSQSDDKDPNEEALLQETLEEISDKYF